MSFSGLHDIRERGFKGFVSISALQASRCFEVPDQPGVYLVLRTNVAERDFVCKSCGGRFKGRNPTVAENVLTNKWVAGTLVLYVGKAGGNTSATLRTRLNAYMRFGQGAAVGHWGGGYIWQVHGSSDFLVCWMLALSLFLRAIESDLIREFEMSYRKLPFATLHH